MTSLNIAALDSGDEEENVNDNSGQLQQNTETPFDSSTSKDQVADISIGAGTSDQGVEPGEEEEEDEFRKDSSLQGAGITDDNNEAGELRGNSGMYADNKGGEYDTNSSTGGDSGITEKNDKRNKSKGLVEEGPGPDS